MPRRHLPISLIAGALLVAVAGCSTGEGLDPSPSPSSATPAAPSSSASATSDMDARYDEADRVVRRATALEEQAIAQGAGSYPAELEVLLADPYLSWSRMGVKQYWDLGWQGAPSESADLITRPRPGVRKDGSELALEACLLQTSTVDSSGATVAESGIQHKTYFFKHVGDDLRLFTASTVGEVEQCPFA